MTENTAYHLIQQAENQLRQCINGGFEAAFSQGLLPQSPIPAYTVEIPADTSHGDFAANAAMVGARAFKMAPVKIAQILQQQISLDGTFFEKCEIAGPGFMNFFLSPLWFSQVLEQVLEQKENYGRTSFGQGKKVLVEFVSANPTGPMHIGNARGGAIGDCLASILSWAGYNCQREFYVNDAGNQIQKFGLSLEIRYLQHFGQAVEMPEDSYHGQDIINHAAAFAEKYGDKYINVDSPQRREALVNYALPLNIKQLEQDLLKYRIQYDNWFLESSLHNNGAVEKVVSLLKEKGCTYETEGALWFKATDFGADKDFVLVRSNGIPTYVVPDIAYHYNKLVTRGFDKAIDILGADHHGYVPRLKAALQALGVDPARLDVILMQMVRLVRDGEIIKASKRSGKAITLVTLLEEVPIDAARFHFNLREANSHFDFDLDLAVECSSQNPVYYVQYAHARICSILKKLAEENISFVGAAGTDFRLLIQPEEKELIRHIAALPAEIIASAQSYDSTQITKYVIELAALFHKFYNACRVQCDNASLTQARLALCVCVKSCIENVLSMLKIDAPESM